MKTKVTMQDVADKLNISKNSVSQALTGKPGVSEETRSLIIQTADEMGYTYAKRLPDYAAKGNAKRTIALIASDYAFSMKSFFGGIYLSIDKELSKHGCSLTIQSISPAHAASITLPEFLEERSVDGVLILSHITTPYLQAVLNTGIPAVMIDHHHPLLHADSILTNNRFSAFDAIRHLAELGHRDIGFVGNIRLSPSYYERLEGMRLAAYELGLTLQEQWLITDAVEDNETVRSRLNGLPSQPTAWFCINDGFGFIVNSALQQMGLRVPEDVSIVSFDNGYLSRIAMPAITTIDVNLPLYAACAVERLLSRIEQPDLPQTEMLLSTSLLVRQSTGPAPEGR
ncbi:substrate-binding domain-containing protein [Paenibacillus sp. R14(2021)]|uniref:substrate-binding domain-containing protein n=1 Tax=Paenibacillus sp. R14(2021) TaxID=2859228 RepID=UPI001C61227C|nr:substrate-binding domain-containing protein [Paenibacillus sp. R14(2021)]